MKRIFRNLSLAAVWLWIVNVLLGSWYKPPVSPRSKRVESGHIELNEQFYAKHFYKSEGNGERNMNINDLTIVTHCTTNKLHHLLDVLEVWNGHISVSILALGDDAAFVDDVIDGIRQCWPQTRSTISFHVVYSTHGSYQANFTRKEVFAYLACKDVMRKMMTRKPKLIQGQSDFQYPHNMMRNIALNGAFTEFVLVTDIDLIPSQNLRTSFVQFAENNKLFPPIVPGASTENSLFTGAEVVYILPVFEYKKYYEIGHSKKELLTAINENNARRYLEVTCSWCHKPIDYQRWLELHVDEDRIDVAYDVPFTSLWEPFYIIRRHSAFYNTGFNKPGHDRLIQMCELGRNGVIFSVLNNAFLLREGLRFKSSTGEGVSARRDQNKLHESFREELRNIGMNEKVVQKC